MGVAKRPATQSFESQIDYSIQYEWSHSSDPAMREHEVQRFVSAFSPLLIGAQRGKALDIGCGGGAGVAALCALGFDAVGVERDPRQAAICRRFAVPVVETDDIVQELLKFTREFDVVVMFDLLEHLQHDEQLAVLKAARTSLTEQGRVLLQVPNASSPVAAHRRYADWTHRCAFTDRSLEFLLRNAGFDAVEVIRPTLSWRPPMRLWRPDVRRGFARWVVERAWQAVLRAEVGNELGGQMPPIGVDMVCIAQ